MKKIIIFVLCALVFFGCKQQPIDGPEGDRDIVVFFSSQYILTSTLKSAASENEKLINKVVLFGFDASDNFVINSKWVISNPFLSGQKITAISKNVKTIWAIANPTVEMESTIPVNVSALKALTKDYPENSPPNTQFLMSGKGTVNDYSVTIPLYFAVAKVEIIPDGFTITSVEVKNTLNRVFVFDENLFNGAPLSIPLVPSGAGVSRVNYASPSSQPDPLVFYVAENNATNTDNSTKFMISGTVEGMPVIDYKLELILDGSIIPIRRNTHYTVKISPTDGTVIISVPGWTDQPTQGHTF